MNFSPPLGIKGIIIKSMQINRNNKKTIDGSRLKIGIVVADFNSDITEKLLAGALGVLAKNLVKKGNIKVARVPGAFEIPYMCQKLAKVGKYDALIALGCVIKGQTQHFRYITSAAADGIMQVILKHDMPIGFGVLTTDDLAQAKARAIGDNNKGAEAAEAVLDLCKKE